MTESINHHRDHMNALSAISSKLPHNKTETTHEVLLDFLPVLIQMRKRMEESKYVTPLKYEHGHESIVCRRNLGEIISIVKDYL